MTIDKATEILGELKEGIDTEGLPDDQPAIQLGIEALKAVKHSRETIFAHRIEPLPGEDGPLC